MEYIIKFILMIAVSGLVFLLASKAHQSASWWVSRLKGISAKLGDINPIWLGIGFFVLLFAELAGILWLMNQSPWAVKALYVFSTANIGFIVLSLWLDKPNQKVAWTIAKIVLSCAFGSIWLIAPQWFVYNVVGVVCAIGFLQLFPSLKFKSALALGLAIIVYDIVGVYLTGWIVSLVQGLTFVPPAVIYIPNALSSASSGMTVIGLGDIIIGGMMLLMAQRYGATKIAFLSYCLGVGLSYGLAILTSHGVPATMFIMPAMLLFTWLAAKYSKNQVWLTDNT
ncbi:MAG: hypothetical protein HGA95_02910 [Caldiserica bacterium]|nr:hypothetical protein [Caldisericota bacterium]